MIFVRVYLPPYSSCMGEVINSIKKRIRDINFKRKEDLYVFFSRNMDEMEEAKNLKKTVFVLVDGISEKSSGDQRTRQEYASEIGGSIKKVFKEILTKEVDVSVFIHLFDPNDGHWEG